MKIRVYSIVTVFLLVFVAASHADVIYQQTFDSPDAAKHPMTYVNWNANVGANAAVFTSTIGASGPIIANTGFLYTTVADQWLAWTDDASFGTFGSITNVSMRLTDGITNEDIRVALNVDGSWYVSQEALNNSTAGKGETVALDVQSASWNNLTFVSGSTLAEGGAAGVLSGGVQAIGVYDVGTGEKVRLDNFMVEAIPEPATLGMIGLVGLTILLIRRKLSM